MAKDLEYYLAQARRIAEHREAGAEREIRKLYQAMLKDLQQFVSDVYVRYAQNDRLTFAELQAAGYDARFLEEIEQRLNIATPRAARELRTLVEQTYSAAWAGMIEGVANSSGDLGAAFADSVAITPEQIKRAVENPVYGLTLKDTLEKHRKDIIYSIKQTVGIGLMNGDRYTTMARRIAKQVDGDYKKAIRIARTEAHRTREGGNRDAAVAVDTELRHGTTGLRMVKTWRTMKDERVRPQRRRKGKKGWSTRMGSGPNHMVLDGQTVLADQPFDLGGGVTADAPGSSGVAGHDINCRCYVSYEMMTDAEYYAKTGKHFPGWKGKADPAPKYAKDHSCELAAGFGTDHYDNMHDMLVNCQEPNVADVWKKYESQIGVGDAHHSGGAFARDSRVYLNIDNVAKGNTYEKAYQTAFHECGHAIDSLARSAVTGNASWGARHYSSAYKGGLFPQTIKDEVKALVNAKDKELKALFKSHAATGDAKWFFDNGFIDRWYYHMYESGSYTAERIIPKYAKSYAYSAVQREVTSSGNKYAYGDLSDMLEGVTGAKIQCGIGHGATYWKDRTYDGVADGLATEAFAEMIDSAVSNPESLDMIKKYLPNSYKVFLEMLEDLL